MRTLLFMVSLALSCMAILSLTSANPIIRTQDIAKNIFISSTSASFLEDEEDGTRQVIGHINGSKLVITHIIKTVEFEVGLEDDAAVNDTTSSTPGYVEAEIDVINPELLKEVVAELPTTLQPEASIDGTKNEESEDIA